MKSNTTLQLALCQPVRSSSLEEDHPIRASSTVLVIKMGSRKRSPWISQENSIPVCIWMARSMSLAAMMARTREWLDARPMISSMNNGSLSKDWILQDAHLQRLFAITRFTCLGGMMVRSDFLPSRSIILRLTSGLCWALRCSSHCQMQQQWLKASTSTS